GAGGAPGPGRRGGSPVWGTPSGAPPTGGAAGRPPIPPDSSPRALVWPPSPAARRGRGLGPPGQGTRVSGPGDDLLQGGRVTAACAPGAPSVISLRVTGRARSHPGPTGAAVRTAPRGSLPC